MICFVSVYFCTEMKAMSGCEPNNESDTVCIRLAMNSVMDRMENGSGGVMIETYNHETDTYTNGCRCEV